MPIPVEKILELDNSFDMEAMKIKFGGGDIIDANTLVNSLIHFINIVQEVNKDVSKELGIERKIDVKIKANEPGSFVVDMAVQATSISGVIAGLFSTEMVSYAANVVQVVGGVFTAAKALKGKKPKEITQVDNSIKLTDVEGNSSYYDFTGANLTGANIYIGNPTVQAAVAKEFETLDADNNVTDFQILDRKDNQIAVIEKIEFSDLAEPEPPLILITGQDGRVITVPQVLQIKAQDWTFKKAWDFYMNGHIIKAKIKDQIFIEKVLNREETFLAGDSLDVYLDITQSLDKSADVWVNKAYAVKEIRKHIKPAQQKPLF